jgi:hypothetical protein
VGQWFRADRNAALARGPGNRCEQIPRRLGEELQPFISLCRARRKNKFPSVVVHTLPTGVKVQDCCAQLAIVIRLLFSMRSHLTRHLQASESTACGALP